MEQWVVVAMVVVVVASVEAMEEKIYMKRSGFEDQASSASGYSYKIHSGKPYSYATYSLPSQRSYSHFGYPPITVGKYTQELALPELPVEEVKPETPLIATLQQLPLEDVKLPLYRLNSYGVPVGYGPLPIVSQAPQLAVSNYISGGGASNLADSASFNKGGGSSYDEADRKAHGSKSSSGYKQLEEHDTASKGHHDNEAQKGYYAKEGANKAANHEEGQHYDTNEASAKAVQGGSFKKANGRRKGSKTTGYHRVHHKDEYKKDHSFYDEADSNGSFHKYGDFDAKKAQEKGAFAKGGRAEAAHRQGEYGAKGFADKGKYDERDSGFKGQKGNAAYYKDQEQYSKKEGQQVGKEYGYKKDDEDASGYL